MRSLLYFAAVLTLCPSVRADVRRCARRFVRGRRRPLPGMQSRSSGRHVAVTPTHYEGVVWVTAGNGCCCGPWPGSRLVMASYGYIGVCGDTLGTRHSPWDMPRRQAGGLDDAPPEPASDRGRPQLWARSVGCSNGCFASGPASTLTPSSRTRMGAPLATDVERECSAWTCTHWCPSAQP
jgi:hypothetical protein